MVEVDAGGADGIASLSIDSLPYHEYEGQHFPLHARDTTHATDLFMRGIGGEGREGELRDKRFLLPVTNDDERLFALSRLSGDLLPQKTIFITTGEDAVGGFLLLVFCNLRQISVLNYCR